MQKPIMALLLHPLINRKCNSYGLFHELNDKAYQAWLELFCKNGVKLCKTS